MDVQEKITTQEQNVDNPHDKGYKRIKEKWKVKQRRERMLL